MKRLRFVRATCSAVGLQSGSDAVTARTLRAYTRTGDYEPVSKRGHPERTGRHPERIGGHPERSERIAFRREGHPERSERIAFNPRQLRSSNVVHEPWHESDPFTRVAGAPLLQHEIQGVPSGQRLETRSMD